MVVCSVVEGGQSLLCGLLLSLLHNFPQLTLVNLPSSLISPFGAPEPFLDASNASVMQVPLIQFHLLRRSTAMELFYSAQDRK